MVYEASTTCTSIVVEHSENGKPIHIRTMDWELPFLKPLTIDVVYTRNNQIVANATTWAGYVGVLTGMAFCDTPFSVSVNYREGPDGSYW